MALGNIFGGIVTGGLAVNQALNENEKVRIEQEKAARDQADYDEKQAMKDGLKKIGQDEADAETNAAANAHDNQSYVDSGAAADALTEQAKNYNKDLTANEVAGIKDAYSQADSNFQAKEGALATARNSAFKAAPTADVYGPADPSLGKGQKQQISMAYGGIKPEAVNKYRFALQRANVFQNAGNFEAAQKIKKDASTEASSAFVGAILNQDRDAAFGLYQTFPNGHFLQSLDFDKDGNIVTEDDSGHQKVTPKFDVILGALAKSGDPDKAVALMAGRMTAEEKSAMAQQMLELKTDMANKAIDTKMAIAKMNDDRGFAGLLFRAINGKGGSGSGESSGSGKSGEGVLGGKFNKLIDSANPESAKQAVDSEVMYKRLLKSNPSLVSNQDGDATATQMAMALGTGKILPTVNMKSDASFAWSAKDGASNKWTLEDNVDPLKTVGSIYKDKDGNPDGAQVAADIRKAFPKEYAAAIRLSGNREAYGKLNAAANDESVIPAERLQARRMVNIINSIGLYGTAPDSAASKDAPAASPTFSAADLSEYKRLGITPNAPLVDVVAKPFVAVGKAVAGAAKTVASGINTAQFDLDLRDMKNGATDRFTARRLQEAAESDPALDAKLKAHLGADYRLKIKAYSLNDWK